MGPEELVRRRLRDLIRQQFTSLDRFYLETAFSKGHLSDILRGKGSPSVTTLAKLSAHLGVTVRDLFIDPDGGPRDRALSLLARASPDAVQKVLRLLSDAEED